MVEKVVNRCDTCNKSPVCKYKANMKELTDKVNCQLAYINKDLPFSIARIDCDYYSAEQLVSKGW